jgi:hypothetical protein
MLLESKNKRWRIRINRANLVFSFGGHDLPFCLSGYTIKKPQFNFGRWYHMVDITIYKLYIMLSWGQDEF